MKPKVFFFVQTSNATLMAHSYGRLSREGRVGPLQVKEQK